MHITEPNLKSVAHAADSIKSSIFAALHECSRYPKLCESVFNSDFTNLLNTVLADLFAFAQKDPAAKGELALIAKAYSSFQAVLHYRVAHWVVTQMTPAFNIMAEEAALIISEKGKLLSGVEIHPRCIIGSRFVLDHGYGTVIGETAFVGNDCYILNGVTIGAARISNNKSGKRHPTIGDRVEIVAFARLLGDIIIGNDVFIGPHTLIIKNISSNSIVTTRTEMQVRVRNKNSQTGKFDKRMNEPLTESLFAS